MQCRDFLTELIPSSFLVSVLFSLRYLHHFKLVKAIVHVSLTLKFKRSRDPGGRKILKQEKYIDITA